jgi:hypothetical protein
MWMLHIIQWTISSSQIVYVNVTSFYAQYSVLKMFMQRLRSMNNIQFSNCLCKCYISFYEQYSALKLFMWMLHIILWTISSSQNCLCECYISFYEKQYPVLKMFMWKLDIILWSISSSQIVMWMLHIVLCTIFSSQNVYVKITFYEQYQVLKMFM